MENDEKHLGKLLDYVRGRLDDAESKALREQIAADPDLQEYVAMLTELQNEGAQSTWTNLHESAHSLLDRLLHDVKSSSAKPDEKRGIVTFDSRLLPIPEGVRPATVDSRRLRFRIDNNHLEISTYPVSMNSCEIIGKLSTEQKFASLIATLKAGGKNYTVMTNQFGLFRFPRVESGRCVLKLQDGKSVVATVEFEL